MTTNVPTRAAAMRRRKFQFLAAIAAAAITTGTIAAIGATGGPSHAEAEEGTGPTTTAEVTTAAVTEPTSSEAPTTTAAPTTTTEPADQSTVLDSETPAPAPHTGDVVDESPAPGEPGVVSGTGAATGEPASSVSPWAPVALAPVEGDAPAPALLAEEDVLETSPAPSDHAGDLASNEPGCASTCLVRAALIPKAGQPDMTFEVRTNVEARIHVWVSTAPMLVVNGVPTFLGQPPVAMSDGFVTEWSTGLDLAADTTYVIIVRATDHQGHVQHATHQFHTQTPMDDLAAGPDNCVFQCITEGTVSPTDFFNIVGMHVATKVPATLAVFVSTQQPGWIGDTPVLPAEDQIPVQAGLRQTWDFGVTALEGDTTYHVVVKATDADGNTASRIGQFRTMVEPPTDVRITFEKLFVLWDGDASGVNRGELGFAWAVAGETLGIRSEEKLDGGSIVTLDQYNQTWVSVEPGAFLPDVAASVAERDADISGGHCVGGDGVPSQPVESDACDTKTNVGRAGPQTLEMIEELPRCSEFGFTGATADDHCGTFITPELGDDWARMQVIVSYRIG